MFDLKWELNRQDKKCYCYLCHTERSGGQVKTTIVSCLGSISTDYSPKDGLVFLERAMINLKQLGLSKGVRDKLENEILNEILKSINPSKIAVPTGWAFKDGEVQAVQYCVGH